jgi:hypothetical protein
MAKRMRFMVTPFFGLVGQLPTIIWRVQLKSAAWNTCRIPCRCGQGCRNNRAGCFVVGPGTAPLRPERRRVGERRLAGHHFRQQPAGGGAERQAVVLVAEVEPQPGWRGALPITGSMSGRHGRAPIHGFASTGSPNGNSARARGSARSTWIGVGGASRRANSTPVVRRMPRFIGASRKPISESSTGWLSTALPRGPDAGGSRA